MKPILDTNQKDRQPKVQFHWQPVSFKECLYREGLLFFCVLVILAISRWLTPSPSLLGTHQQLFLPPCTLHLVTGRPCPACGGTTSFALMARGDILTAFRANLLAPFLFIAMVVYGLIQLISLIKSSRLSIEMPACYRLIISWSFLIIVLLYGTIRFILWKGP